MYNCIFCCKPLLVSEVFDCYCVHVFDRSGLECLVDRRFIQNGSGGVRWTAWVGVTWTDGSPYPNVCVLLFCYPCVVFSISDAAKLCPKDGKGQSSCRCDETGRRCIQRWCSTTRSIVRLQHRPCHTALLHSDIKGQSRWRHFNRIQQTVEK